MIQFSSSDELPLDQRPPSVLVPTMGALHDGHAALIRRAREIAGREGTVTVSIFLNPLQFNSSSDLETYPRTLEADLLLCRSLGVDAVYTPSPEEFYAADHSISIVENSLSRALCGATRPGHFEGVCTVVLKLFNTLQPSHAIFGKKDYQQLAIIRRLVRDLGVSVQIHGVETVREPDGLAFSSRNLMLTPEHRKDASRIRRALLCIQHFRETGEQRREAYLQTVRKHLVENAPPEMGIEYLEIIDRETLIPLEKVAGPALLATAVTYDTVRLIDNIEI